MHTAPTAFLFQRLHPEAALPERVAGSAAYALRACLGGTRVELCWTDAAVLRSPDADPEIRDGTPFVDFMPGERAYVPLGLRAELPDSVEVFLRADPRAAFTRNGLLPLGSVDVHGPDGEWRVLVRNESSIKHRLFDGEVIAHALFVPVLLPEIRPENRSASRD